VIPLPKQQLSRVASLPASTACASWKTKAASMNSLAQALAATRYMIFISAWRRNVLSKNPDVVVIYIGVNDVWHKTSMGTGTDADKFEKFYEAILKKFKEKNIHVILCTPAVIGEKTDITNMQDGDMNKYSAIIRAIAVKENLPLVDLRTAFLNYNLKNNTENKSSGILTTDGVHLNPKGNQLVADEMWKVIRSNN
jgi:lysophospholipase L1-like esterase